MSHKRLVIDLCSDGYTQPPIPRKRQRTAQRLPKETRLDAEDKRQCYLQNMPFEILIEAFSFLNPLDLIQLSRTCKTIRATLLNKHHAYFWKNARKNVNKLPKRPEDMSEPAYARFMLETTCQICYSPNAMTVVWMMRMRLCSDCFRDTKHFDRSVMNGFVGPTFIGDEILDLMPRYSSHYNFYHVPSVINARDEFQRIHNDAEQLLRWKSEREESLKHARKFEEDYCQWDAQHRINIAEEVAEAQVRRREAIIRRLSEEDYGNEFNHFSGRQWTHFKQHGDVLSAKELTDEIWNCIRKRLIPLMMDIRAARLKKERKQLIKTRLSALDTAFKRYRFTRPHDEIISPVADFLTHPPVLSAINLPSEYQVDVNTFAQLLQEIPQFTRKWLKTVDQKLLELMRQELSTHAPDFKVPTLDAATVFFRCISCKDILTRPSLIDHVCPDSLANWFDNTAHELRKHCEHLGSAPLLGLIEDQFSFHLPAFKRARLIIEACEWDPDHDTMDELEMLDPFLECLVGTCTREMATGYRHAMRWRRGILHSLDFAKPLWKVVPPADAKKLEKLESDKLPPDAGPRPYICPQCHIGPVSESELHAHLRTSHNTVNPDKRKWSLHPSAQFQARAKEVTWFGSRKRAK